jgi:hypothetical protein
MDVVTLENPEWEPPILPALSVSELGDGVCIQAPPPKNSMYRPSFQVYNTAFTMQQCRDLCVIQPEKYKFFSVLEAFDATGACFCFGNWYVLAPRRFHGR